METIYLNWRGLQGLETVDEFTREEGQTRREFRLYVREMADNYRGLGMAVYSSSRPCKAWREKG